MEQEYDVLTQEIHFETARNLYQRAETCSNIINKTNVRLGGLNYVVNSETWNDSGLLLIGLSTAPYLNSYSSENVTTIGFVSNTMDHPQKFAGGYKYVKSGSDVFGQVMPEILLNSLRSARKARKIKPMNIVIYLCGMSESRFSIVKEEYVRNCHSVFKTLGEKYSPQLTIIVGSKGHSTRLYARGERDQISNLQPGTIVDSVIVSPDYNKFFHCGAVARQGTCKATKYTVLYPESPKMEWIQRMTNDLCYMHEIVFHPVSLPAPLYLTAEMAERGTKNLAEKNGPIIFQGIVDFDATNAKYGYRNKGLADTRFNA